MKTKRFWSLDCDIISGDQEAGVKIATATDTETAQNIAATMNRIADFTDGCVALNAAIVERERQNAKWGEQNHDPITWSAILTEECGEFAEAALHHKFGGPAADGLREEAIQCAAVALQIVECLDRNARIRGCAACDRGDYQLGHVEGCPAIKEENDERIRGDADARKQTGSLSPSDDAACSENQPEPPQKHE